MPVWDYLRRRIRILKDAAGAGRFERLRSLAKRERLARDGSQRHRVALGHSEVRGDDDLRRTVQPSVVVAELHAGGWHLQQFSSQGHERHAGHELADQPALEMRVAVDRAADRPWCAGPRFQTSRAVRDRPTHEAVDRHTRIGANVSVIDPRHLSPAKPQDDAAYPLIGDQDVRSSAQRADRQPGGLRERADGLRLGGSANVDQPVGEAADLERGQRSERRVAVDAIGRDRGSEPRVEVVAHRPSNLARRCRKASSAADRVHPANSTQSPGAS